MSPKSVVDELFVEAKASDEKALLSFAARSGQANRIAGMLSLTESEPGIPVVPADLDADPWLFNVQNGTLDLRTGRLRAHDPARLISKLAPVDFDPDAKCPTWSDFLTTITGGDESLTAFLQKAIGYALTGDTREQVLFLLYGTGSNGKSTFLEIIRGMLGDYAKVADFSTFAATETDKIRNDLARLVGVRFVPAVELEAGHRLAESLVKQATGGDVITARFLHREFFEFRPSFKLFLAANHKPVVRGQDHAIWRRIRLVPFTITIPDELQDRELSAKLRAELPGILAWAVRGCLDWQRNGLGIPEAVKKATGGYREEMDMLANFLADCCVVSPNAEVPSKMLYDHYKAWCEANGERAQGKNTFGRMLQERGFEAIRIGHSQARGWRGIGLREDNPPPGADKADKADTGSGFSPYARAQEANYRKSVSALSAASASDTLLSSGDVEQWPRDCP